MAVGKAVGMPTHGMPDLTRRQLLQRGAASAIGAAMAVSVNGKLLSPKQAKAQGVALRVLTEEEGALLEALGDVMVPGASEAGIANFVDAQLAKEWPLLMVTYLDWPGPLPDFYSQGLAALENASQTMNGTAFADATSDQQHELVASLFSGTVEGWDGPPAPLFYLATRADAVDVVYGTLEGFERMNIPYMPQNITEDRW
jgi:hypothetical protein